MPRKTAKMTRGEAINIIKGLYPADSPFEDTARIGQHLLERAKQESWQDQPTEVLTRYAELCIEFEKETPP